jgi:superfamily I DNA/RNA helicase
MELNDEQQLVVNHPVGQAALLLAGAGSGKTHACTARIAHLIKMGVPPYRILALTFTNKAAAEIRERVLTITGLTEESGPHLTTIHSLALRLIRRSPHEFGFGDKVTPLDEWDQNELLKKIVDRLELEVDPFLVREKVSFHRARGIGFAVDYTEEVDARAQRQHAGYHRLTEEEIKVWKVFAEEKQNSNLVDFDDMLHLVNRKAASDPAYLRRLHGMFEHVLMDEAQDTSVTAWTFVNNLLGPENRNLMCVGDVSQCHPPGEMITVIGRAQSGRRAAQMIKRPIETFVDGDQVVPWSRQYLKSLKHGATVKVSKRWYEGPMLTVIASNGSRTRVTPQHKFWVKSLDKAVLALPGYVLLTAQDILDRGVVGMAIPLAGQNKKIPLSLITVEDYEGWVYSFDVAEYESYIVNDLVVHNSIYGFNGSTPELILDFAKHWRGSTPTIYKLRRNHRSVPEVVSLANSIQQKMTVALPLAMESFRGGEGESGTTRLLRGDSPRAIARRITQHIASTPGALRKYCILVRTSMQIRDIEGEMVQARIPYVIRGGRGLLQTEEVRDILSYLRLATNHKDFPALVRSASAPRRGMGDATLEQLRKRAVLSFKGDLVAAAALSGTKFAGYAAAIKAIGKAASPVLALEVAIRASGYVDHIKKKYAKDRDKVDMKLENLTRLRDMVTGLCEEREITTEDLVFQLSMDKAEVDDERGSVTISTTHSAKGLEWDTVFVTNVVETSMPHWRSCGDVGELDEERRLFYVAVTRARNHCILCVPDKVLKGSGYGDATPSRFLTELGIEV